MSTGCEMEKTADQNCCNDESADDPRQHQVDGQRRPGNHFPRIAGLIARDRGSWGLNWQLDRSVVKFGNISSYGQVDAYFGGLGKLMIILFEAPPNLACLHSNDRAVAGRVICRAVGEIRSN